MYLGVMLKRHLNSVVNVFSPEHPIVQGHSGVVVDELKDLYTRHLCSLQDCPALCLVEEGRDCDHCIFDWLFCKREEGMNTCFAYLNIH